MSWYQGEWVETSADYVEVHSWCPQCQPEGVPEPYTLTVCAIHYPTLEGSADVQARGEDGAYWSSGAVEAGGESNSAWCRMIHPR
jgi:hypothetical protein